MTTVNELLEAERVIFDVENNPGHPANDKSNRDYEQSNRAYRLLKQKAVEARAELEIKRYFAVKK